MNVHQGLELSFQAFADLMMVLDAHGRVLEFRGRESSPYAFSNAILGKNIADVFSPLEVKKIERALGHVEKTGSVATFEYSLSHANVEFWFDARLAPLSKSQFLLTARDITICRETESRLNRKMQQLSALRSLDLLWPRPAPAPLHVPRSGFDAASCGCDRIAPAQPQNESS
jgi:hypothetical protein